MKIFVGYFPFRLFPQHFHFDSMEYGRWHRKMFDDGIVPANIVFYWEGRERGPAEEERVESWAWLSIGYMTSLLLSATKLVSNFRYFVSRKI